MEIDNQKFEFTKLPADVGSFILMRLIGLSGEASAKVSKGQEEKQSTIETVEQLEKKPTSGAENVRMIAFLIFSSGVLPLDDFRILQTECLKTVSRYEPMANGTEALIPVMRPDGRFVASKTLPPIDKDFGLMNRLVTESLVFNYADFFGRSVGGS